MQVLLYISVRQLLDRKRQTLVSLSGIVLGVAFFLAVSSLMRGSELDFIRRLVDNSPHITISDEFRIPRSQPVHEVYPGGAVELRNLTPQTETRGIRGFDMILSYIRTIPGSRASAVLLGQALIQFAGRDYSVTLNGMTPEEIKGVTTIENYLIEGTLDALIADADGIIIGSELAKKLGISRGNILRVAAATGQIRNFRVVGIFRTGRAAYDQVQVFVSLKRVQALLNRPQRVNSIIVKLTDPHSAHEIARSVEQRSGFKSVSWQEASEDLMNTLSIRNTIMYTVVSAVLIVAAFGIYNIISTVILEKQRDIAILRSMGFFARDIQIIFITQGIIIGLLGCIGGIPMGMGLMYGLMQIRFTPPGSSVPVSMPIDWGLMQFFVAVAFALIASITAAFLPSRKAARVQPVEILRGGAW